MSISNSQEVIVTHAPNEEARAALVAEKLAALGYIVRQEAGDARALSPFARRKLATDVDKAAVVLVLWSREAKFAPALAAIAARAKAKGKLAVARLDSAALPARVSLWGSPSLAQWQGREKTRGWRQLVANVSAKAGGKLAPKRAAQPAPAPTRVSAPTPAPAPVRAAAASAEPAKKKGGGGLAIFALVALIAVGAAGYYFLVGF